MIEGRVLNPVATARPIAHICVQCVGVCDSLFEQHQRKNARLEKMPTPRQLVAHLNDYIIGRERVGPKSVPFPDFRPKSVSFQARNRCRFLISAGSAPDYPCDPHPAPGRSAAEPALLHRPTESGPGGDPVGEGPENRRTGGPAGRPARS
jgi:hypothetical protein